MKIHTSINITINNPVVTIGSFDGVHLGHRAILDLLKSKAMECGGESVVITFSPHPRVALGHDVENLYFLNTPFERELLLREQGVGHLIVLPFTRELAQKTMLEFLTSDLCQTLHAKCLVVGYNHRFGSDHKNDHEELISEAEKLGIEVLEVSKKSVDERDISSTTIRNLVLRGDFSLANRYLGKPYHFVGQISATGELILDAERKLIPLDGSYKVELEVLGECQVLEAKVTCNQIIIPSYSGEANKAVVSFLSKM